MDDILFPIILLSLIIVAGFFVAYRRYYTGRAEKSVYSVAFRMDDQPVADTAECKPQLIDPEDIIIRYEDIEMEQEV